MANHLLAPKCLYGDTKSTRAAWAEIAKIAWEDGNWTRATVDLEMVSLDSLPGPIIVWNDERRGTGARIPWKTTDHVWQFNWILEVHPASFDEQLRQTDRHVRLVLEGMREFWFNIGLLQAEPIHPPFLAPFLANPGPKNEKQRTIVLPLLRRFVRFLPELARLDDRIAIASGVRGKGMHVVGLAIQLRMILYLASLCDLLKVEEKHSLFAQPTDVMVRRLLELNLDDPT